MVWNNAPLTGYFAYDGTIFSIENVGGGVNIFAEMGPRKISDHPTLASSRDNAISSQSVTPRAARREPKIAPFANADRQALEAKTIAIDLMMLYTGNVARRYVRDLDDLVALAVEQTNEILSNSGLGNVTLRLVHSQLIDYDGSKDDQFSHLYAMVDGLGAFTDVKRLRNEKRADIVGLIIDNPNGCGLSTRIGRSQTRRFSLSITPAQRSQCRLRMRLATYSESGMTATLTQKTLPLLMGMDMSMARNGEMS